MYLIQGNLWDIGEMPSDWRTGERVKLYKQKEDIFSGGYYKSIKLSTHVFIIMKKKNEIRIGEHIYTHRH